MVELRRVRDVVWKVAAVRRVDHLDVDDGAVEDRVVAVAGDLEVDETGERAVHAVLEVLERRGAVLGRRRARVVLHLGRAAQAEQRVAHAGVQAELVEAVEESVVLGVEVGVHDVVVVGQVDAEHLEGL